MVLHNHLLINGVTSNPPKDEVYIKAWLRDLVVQIGMKITMGPLSFYVNKEGNKGLTAIVGIETSHIAVHIWDEYEPGLIQFDLYTCSFLPLDAVLRNLEEHLGLTDYQYIVLERSVGFNVTHQSTDPKHFPT